MPIWFKDYNLEALISYANVNIIKYLGIEFTELGNDYLDAKMPVDHKTMTPHGLLHGGASCVLAETIGSCGSNLCIDPNTQQAVGIEINANHIKRIQKGYVKGRAKPIHLGRSIHIWEIKIRNQESDQLICVSRLTAKILSKNKNLIA